MKSYLKSSLFSFVFFVMILGCWMPVMAEENVETPDITETEKGETTIEFPTERVVTYNGKGRTITVKNVTGSTGEITYKYYIDEECTQLVTLENSDAVEEGLYPRNPGVYYVIASVAEDDNFKGFTSEPSILIIKPRAVETMGAENTSSGVKLTWSKVPEAQGYILYRKTSGKSYQILDVIEKNSTLKYTDKSAKAGTKYWYNIEAYSPITGDDEYVIISKKRANGRQIIWNKLTITNYNTYVGLKWSKATDTNVKGYYIYRKLSGESSYKKVKTISGRSTTSWKDYSSNTLVNGKKAQYYIKAYYGKSTNVVSSTSKYTNYYLSRPSAYKSDTYLKWNKNSKASGYIVRTYSGLFAETGYDDDKLSSSSKTSYQAFPTNLIEFESKVRSYKKVDGKYYYSAWSKLISN